MKTFGGYVSALLVAWPALVFAAPHAATAESPTSPATLVSTSAGQSRIHIIVTVVSYPGVPERSACRLLYKAVNQSREEVELSTQLTTFDSEKMDLNTWLVPTGAMKPGQSVERLYSCKTASFITLDQKTDYGWPRSCRVNGEKLTPCTVPVKIDFNLPEFAGDPPAASLGKGSGH